MHSIIYKSEAIEGFDIPKIYKMLSKARESNSENGITGCLVFHNQKFMQLLEGPEEKVMPLFEQIRADKRHHNVTYLGEHKLEDRLFDQWSMAFHDFGDPQGASQYKLGMVDQIFESSKALDKPNPLALTFFDELRGILELS